MPDSSEASCRSVASCLKEKQYDAALEHVETFRKLIWKKYVSKSTKTEWPIDESSVLNFPLPEDCQESRRLPIVTSNILFNAGRCLLGRKRVGDLKTLHILVRDLLIPWNEIVATNQSTKASAEKNWDFMHRMLRKSLPGMKGIDILECSFTMCNCLARTNIFGPGIVASIAQEAAKRFKLYCKLHSSQRSPSSKHTLKTISTDQSINERNSICKFFTRVRILLQKAIFGVDNEKQTQKGKENSGFNSSSSTKKYKVMSKSYNIRKQKSSKNNICWRTDRISFDYVDWTLAHLRLLSESKTDMNGIRSIFKTDLLSYLHSFISVGEIIQKSSNTKSCQFKHLVLSVIALSHLEFANILCCCPSSTLNIPQRLCDDSSYKEVELAVSTLCKVKELRDCMYNISVVDLDDSCEEEEVVNKKPPPSLQYEWQYKYSISENKKDMGEHIIRKQYIFLRRLWTALARIPLIIKGVTYACKDSLHSWNILSSLMCLLERIGDCTRCMEEEIKNLSSEKNDKNNLAFNFFCDTKQRSPFVHMAKLQCQMITLIVKKKTDKDVHTSSNRENVSAVTYIEYHLDQLLQCADIRNVLAIDSESSAKDSTWVAIGRYLHNAGARLVNAKYTDLSASLFARACAIDASNDRLKQYHSVMRQLRDPEIVLMASRPLILQQMIWQVSPPQSSMKGVTLDAILDATVHAGVSLPSSNISDDDTCITSGDECAMFIAEYLQNIVGDVAEEFDLNDGKANALLGDLVAALLRAFERRMNCHNVDHRDGSKSVRENCWKGAVRCLVLLLGTTDCQINRSHDETIDDDKRQEMEDSIGMYGNGMGHPIRRARMLLALAKLIRYTLHDNSLLHLWSQYLSNEQLSGSKYKKHKIKRKNKTSQKVIVESSRFKILELVKSSIVLLDSIRCCEDTRAMHDFDIENLIYLELFMAYVWLAVANIEIPKNDDNDKTIGKKKISKDETIGFMDPARVACEKALACWGECTTDKYEFDCNVVRNHMRLLGDVCGAMGSILLQLRAYESLTHVGDTDQMDLCAVARVYRQLGYKDMCEYYLELAANPDPNEMVKDTKVTSLKDNVKNKQCIKNKNYENNSELLLVHGELLMDYEAFPYPNAESNFLSAYKQNKGRHRGYFKTHTFGAECGTATANLFHWQLSPRRAIVEAQRALSVFEALFRKNNGTGQQSQWYVNQRFAIGLLTCGALYETIGKPSSATEYYNKGIELCLATHLSFPLRRFYRAMGLLAARRHRWSEAYQWLDKGVPPGGYKYLNSSEFSIRVDLSNSKNNRGCKSKDKRETVNEDTVEEDGAVPELLLECALHCAHYGEILLLHYYAEPFSKSETADNATKATKALSKAHDFIKKAQSQIYLYLSEKYDLSVVNTNIKDISIRNSKTALESVEEGIFLRLMEASVLDDTNDISKLCDYDISGINGSWGMTPLDRARAQLLSGTQQRDITLIKQALTAAEGAGDAKVLKKIYRTLASLLQTEKVNSDTETAYAMFCSIGIRARQYALETHNVANDALAKKILGFGRNRFPETVDEHLSSEASWSRDINVFQMSVNAMPDAWVVVSIALSVEGHLVISRIQSGHSTVLVSINVDSHIVNALKELDSIIKSQDDTTTVSQAEAELWSNRDKDRWWLERREQDERVSKMLRDIENSCLGIWKGMLMGEIIDQELLKSISAPIKELSLRLKLTNRQQRLIYILVSSATVNEENNTIELLRKAVISILSDERLVHVRDDETYKQGCKSVDHSAVEAIVLLIQVLQEKCNKYICDKKQNTKIRGKKSGKSKTLKVPRSSVAELTASFGRLKVVDLRKKLCERGLTKTGRKSELVSRLATAVATQVIPLKKSRSSSNYYEDDKFRKEIDSEEDNNEKYTNIDGKSKTLYKSSIDRNHVILVLDETLQRLPWESLSCVIGQPISRMPALQFIFHRVLQNTSNESITTGSIKDCSHDVSRVSAARATYTDDKLVCNAPSASWPKSANAKCGKFLLNPSGTLPDSERRLNANVFDALKTSYNWEGTSGKPPSEEEYNSMLENSSIFVYCGHNAGERWMPSRKVLKLSKCPTTLLMGCSSGRLRCDGDFGPHGTAISYLAAGAPAVAATLWDVTDRDIDRFSQELLRQWLPKINNKTSRLANISTLTKSCDKKSLAHAVSSSRDVCRLRFVVGASPVCYGLPVIATL